MPGRCLTIYRSTATRIVPVLNPEQILNTRRLTVLPAAALRVTLSLNMCIMNGMDTKQKLQEALKDAMRARDEPRKRTIRMALSNIKLAEIDRGEELDENAVLAILQKEVKQRQEVIEESMTANRPDLAEEAELEIVILQEFLPAQLTPEELERIARQVIDEVGASSISDMGSVMKVLIPRLEGRASGQEASQMVRNLLQ